jgi:hypothetical protein
MRLVKLLTRDEPTDLADGQHQNREA